MPEWRYWRRTDKDGTGIVPVPAHWNADDIRKASCIPIAELVEVDKGAYDKARHDFYERSHSGR